MVCRINKKSKRIISILLLISTVALLSFNSFSAIIYSNGDKFVVDDNELFGNNKFLALAGDSYAGYFARFEKGKECAFEEFTLAGSTIVQNKDRLAAAMCSAYPIVLLSIGVNDCEQETELEKFTQELESLIKQGKFNGKKIIVHTYMIYDAYAMMPTKYPPQSYDRIIQLEANMNDHVHYINMHDYEHKMYQQADCLHYNKMFYDVLYDRVMKKIDELENKQY